MSIYSTVTHCMTAVDDHNFTGLVRNIVKNAVAPCLSVFASKEVFLRDGRRINALNTFAKRKIIAV